MYGLIFRGCYDVFWLPLELILVNAPFYIVAYLVLSSGLNQVQSRLVPSFRVVISFSIVTLVGTETVFKNN